MNYLTFPLPLFRQHLRDLLRQPTRPLRCPVGISRWEGHVELIAAPSDTPTRNALRDSEQRRILLLAFTDDFILPPIPPDGAGVLLIGRAQQRGRAVGFLQLAPNQIEPIHTLRLVGAGMFTVPLTNSPTHPSTDLPIDPLTHSRTIGALGSEVWQRLITLRYALIGVGRTGSHLAPALARLGARHLTLIDPDIIEPHNLGEMAAVTDADVGKPKVEALASCLASLIPHPSSLISVPASITHLRALRAAQACDALFCCCDHDSARLATAALAALFCKPLIDIGTGILQIPNHSQPQPTSANLSQLTNSPTHRAGTESPPLPLTTHHSPTHLPFMRLDRLGRRRAAADDANFSTRNFVTAAERELAALHRS